MLTYYSLHIIIRNKLLHMYMHFTAQSLDYDTHMCLLKWGFVHLATKTFVKPSTDVWWRSLSAVCLPVYPKDVPIQPWQTIFFIDLILCTLALSCWNTFGPFSSSKGKLDWYSKTDLATVWERLACVCDGHVCAGYF